MSYILEALRKSQQERELGNVPRLQAVTFDDEPAHAPPHRWVYAALLLAVVAVAIALFAVLRAAPDGRESATAALLPAERSSRDLTLVPAPSAAVGLGAEARRGDDGGAAPGSVKPSVQASAPSVAQSSAQPRSGPQERQDANTLNTSAPELIAEPVPAPTKALPQTPTEQPPPPETVSVQPEVLVVPAAPKPGQPLPRGADELRRAVLGPGSSSSIESTAALPSPPAPAATDYARQQVPEHAPVPADLIADIEAFKKQVGSGPPAARATPEAVLPPPPPRAMPAAEKETPLPPPPSVALRGKLPDFRMSVHIYDAEPARRFVYINGRKLRENDESREGLRLERVVADGAVLSYQGESFFQPR